MADSTDLAPAIKRKYFDDITGPFLPLLGSDSGVPSNAAPTQQTPGQMYALGGQPSTDAITRFLGASTTLAQASPSTGQTNPSLSDYGDYDPTYEAAMQGYTGQENDINSQYTQARQQLQSALQSQLSPLAQQHQDDLEMLSNQMAGQGILRSSNNLYGQSRLDTGYQQQVGGLNLQNQQANEALDRQRADYLQQILQGRLGANQSHANFLAQQAQQRAAQQAAAEAAKQAAVQQQQQNQQQMAQITPQLTNTPTGQIVAQTQGQPDKMPPAILYEPPKPEPTIWQPPQPANTPSLPANVQNYQRPDMGDAREQAGIVSNPVLANAFGVQYQEPPSDTPINQLPWNIGKPNDAEYAAQPKWQQMGFANEGAYNYAMDPNSHVQMLLSELNSPETQALPTYIARRMLSAAMNNQNEGFYPKGVFDTDMFSAIRRRLGL